MSDVSTRNYFLKFSIVVWLQPRSPFFQVCATTTRLFFNPSTVNKMKLYRYSKSSFGYLWTKTESILDHQQRVHILRTFISYHAISTGSFFCQVNFPICNGLNSSTEWSGLGLDHVGLCYALLAWTCLSDFFRVMSILLLFVSKLQILFLVDSQLKSSFPALSREENTFSLAPDSQRIPVIPTGT